MVIKITSRIMVNIKIQTAVKINVNEIILKYASHFIDK